MTKTRHNLPDTCVKVLGTIGDVNGPEYGGGIVWLHVQGHAVLEYANGAIEYTMVTGDESPLVEVHSTHIDEGENLRRTYDWVDWQAIASDWPEGWQTLDEMLDSTDPMDKALIIESIGLYYGWANVDEHPLFYTVTELRHKWYGDEPDEEEARLDTLRRIAERYADHHTPQVRRFFETGTIANPGKFMLECEKMRDWYYVADQLSDIYLLANYALKVAEED